MLTEQKATSSRGPSQPAEGPGDEVTKSIRQYPPPPLKLQLNKPKQPLYGLLQCLIY